MNLNAENVKDVIDNLDLGGMTGRDAMRHIGRETIMAILSVRGAAKLLSVKLGFANSGALSVATADLGWRQASTRDDAGMGTTKPRGTTPPKIKGSLPFKTANAIAKVLNIDTEENEVTWDDFKRALDVMGDNWLDHLFSRLNGRDSDGGKDFTSWIDSNRAADIAKAEAERLAAEKAEREADPMFQAKERIKRLDKLLDQKELEIAELKARVAALESPRSGHGVPLTKDMVRILRQRFHPDRNNGDPELCEAVIKLVNGLAQDAGL